MNLTYGVILFSLLFAGCNYPVSQNKKEPAVVKVEESNGQYRLTVDGRPFYVNGAGCEYGNIGSLAKHGANSFRTWRTENGQRDAVEILDEAQKYGLMVLMGLDMGRERHGFDYSDTVRVRQQFEYLKGEVERLKHHPALLGWAIGNELNLHATDLSVYKAVNDIAEMIHSIDPNHPTTTPLAGISRQEADYIKENCPDIDFLSIQMYGDIVNLQERITDAGWEGPYMVTEWGATGHWETDSTEWGAPIEETSTVKAANVLERYEKAILSDQKHCMGSYAFLWGQKQERTPTWYGLFTETGETVEAVDVLQFLWTGEWPENRCPSIRNFVINGKTAFDNIILRPNEKISAIIDATDPENDPLICKWEIMHESTSTTIGGDAEYRPDTVFRQTGGAKEEFKSPSEAGAYRILVYVLDGKGHAATANIPFLVKEQ